MYDVTEGLPPFTTFLYMRLECNVTWDGMVQHLPQRRNRRVNEKIDATEKGGEGSTVNDNDDKCKERP